MTKRDKRYVIIGNGVAGTTAAETLRTLDPHCSIHVLTNEPYPLYNRVALPRFLQGAIGEQKVLLHDFAWHEQRAIHLITESMVTGVAPEERVVVTDRGEHLPYDALLVATGGWAHPLRVPGAEQTKHIYTFVTLDDARTIIARLQESRTALAYGGSFIAYELCDGFARRKLDTTWMMRGPCWLRTCLDRDGGEVVDTIARKCGVEVIYGDEIEAVVARHGVPSYVKTKKGRQIQADLIGVGLGISRNTALLAQTPVQVRKGILVNEYLETNVPGVYAAGDVAECFDRASGQHQTMGTWDNALAHWRIAGANMAGGHQAYGDVPTYTSPLFDVNIAVIGTAESHHPEGEQRARREPGEKGHENYRKLFFRENKLVGALMIGSPKGRKKLVEVVKSQQLIETAAEREALLTLK